MARPPFSPATARTLLVLSLLLDPLIISYPLHPAVEQWSSTQWSPAVLVILFPIALSAGNAARLSSFARAFVRGRLAVLSSERALTGILALLAGSVIAEAALVLGRAAAPLLVVGAALGIPGAIALVRAFRTQFSLIRQKLEDAKSFESAVQRTAAIFTLGALLCARLFSLLIAISLLPLTGMPTAITLGVTCSLSLLLAKTAERNSEKVAKYRGIMSLKSGDNEKIPPL